MPELWMPGIPRVEPTGQTPIPLGLQGRGLRLFTWHTFEADYTYSPDCVAAARYLNSQRSTSHFVWHPITGALVQLLPANVGARTLRANGPTQHTNAFGDVHMQVEVIARAARPFTQDITPAGRESLSRLMDYLRSWGIPDQWAVTNPPPVYPGPGVTRGIPHRSGHTYHAGWWANDHGDPGAIAAPWTLGAPMRRYPTTADFYALEAELRERGWDITCGPGHVDRGYCAPGKHPHMTNSPHFRRGALDVSWPGAPISDIEALHVELLIEEIRRHPTINYRTVWNWGPGDHEDHLHLDDMKKSGWGDAVKPRPGVRARDGVDLFVSPKAFPNHRPPKNHGYTLAHMVTAQTLLGRMTDPASGLALLRATADGYWGPLTEAATKAAQRILDFPTREQDGIPGPATVRAIQDHLAKPPKVEPPVVVEPPPNVPAPVDPPGRLAGGDRYSTAAQVALNAPTARRAKVYLVAGNAPTLADGLAAAAAGDGVVLYVRAGQDTLPSATNNALARLRPTEIVPVGSDNLVTIPAVLAARAAAGIQ